jgi:hypothetical protein
MIGKNKYGKTTRRDENRELKIENRTIENRELRKYGNIRLYNQKIQY